MTFYLLTSFVLMVIIFGAAIFLSLERIGRLEREEKNLLLLKTEILRKIYGHGSGLRADSKELLFADRQIVESLILELEKDGLVRARFEGFLNTNTIEEGENYDTICVYSITRSGWAVLALEGVDMTV